MARYQTTIRSNLSPAEALAYLADFTHTTAWDPSVSTASKVGDDAVGLGSVFQLKARFGGRDVALEYRIAELDATAGRVVLEAKQPGYDSRDTITVTADGSGSAVHYDARLAFHGVGVLLDPLMSFLFTRLGNRAKAGLERELNPAG